MSRPPKFADDLRPVAAKDSEFRLGPLSCFVLGFGAGVMAILAFGDTNILQYYVIAAFR